MGSVVRAVEQAVHALNISEFAHNGNFLALASSRSFLGEPVNIFT